MWLEYKPNNRCKSRSYVTYLFSLSKLIFCLQETLQAWSNIIEYIFFYTKSNGAFFYYVDSFTCFIVTTKITPDITEIWLRWMQKRIGIPN